MAEEQTVPAFAPNPEFSSRAYIKNMDEYNKMYEESIKDPEGFWGRLAE